MGYDLQAVIGGSEQLRSATRHFPEARLAPLAQGLSLMPMTDQLFDAVTNGEKSEFPDLWKLPGGFGAVLAAWSQQGPVAYVEAEYFGGVGQQAAVAWAGGSIVLGPLTWAEKQPCPPAGSPISQALRRLGVVATPDEDEFSSAGLHRHRETERWISLRES
ncbi:hypothetical protein [Streptomyces sp. HPF1205]|uniref:hypothetical protein n=1 Tax=Streptomyces sp. HPF1205 TaxID=2873262 RepID=UPI001CECE00E|nr:hypothetical protein [Streptomyces sp. HPF1205]